MKTKKVYLSSGSVFNSHKHIDKVYAQRIKKSDSVKLVCTIREPNRTYVFHENQNIGWLHLTQNEWINTMLLTGFLDLKIELLEVIDLGNKNNGFEIRYCIYTEKEANKSVPINFTSPSYLETITDDFQVSAQEYKLHSEKLAKALQELRDRNWRDAIVYTKDKK